MEIGTEISHKIKTAIKSKLVDFGSYVDDELPDYIMVMVANKRSQSQMINDLNLFLGESSKTFCEWLHDLLGKLQEVTEGAFEVKVSVPNVKTKSEVVKPSIKSDNNENESLKISKLSQKPSPIRMASEPSESKVEEGALKSKKGKISERHHKKESKNSGLLQSAVVLQKRPILPPSKQANVNLLKKAMKAAQVSVEDVDKGEYNPELPGSSELPNVSDPEDKKRQREILMEEHKKLQRLKSQQEDIDETTEPVIELEVGDDHDDDLFNTEEIPIKKDRRIVVEKDEDSKMGISRHQENQKKSKEKKPEKRKLIDDETTDAAKQSRSESENDNTTKLEETQQRSGKTKDKRRKPKFIVTLEGVGSEFEAKYEKERKKRRRKGSNKEENRISAPNVGTQVIPVYPPMIQDVHHVPVMPPTNHNPIVPAVQIVPTTLMAPINTPNITGIKDEEFSDDNVVPLIETKCRFWPQCKNGDDCPYYHPGVSCKHFPNCRYGKDCSYVHPPCKFGLKCTSTSCSYSHPSSSSSLTENPTVCRYFPFCTRSDCPFLHPTEKPCRYGPNCTRPGCPFGHSVPPPREQLKWVAPKAHVSERQFAVNEASTTPLQVQ